MDVIQFIIMFGWLILLVLNIINHIKIIKKKNKLQEATQQVEEFFYCIRDSEDIRFLSAKDMVDELVERSEYLLIIRGFIDEGNQQKTEIILDGHKKPVHVNDLQILANMLFK